MRAGRIAATWVEQRHIREVMAALQGYGISTSLAVRIYKRFGDDSARVIAHEPYRLAREVWGIGFKTADKIAQAIGIALDAPDRLQAGVLHALGQAADDGHTLLPEEASSRRRPRCSRQRRSRLPRRSPSSPVPANSSRQPPRGPTATGGGCWRWRPSPVPNPGWPRGCRHCTPRPNTRLRQVFAATEWEVALRWLATRQAIQLAPEQEAGVRMALTAPVSILTGGPGTGKTHTPVDPDAGHGQAAAHVLAAPPGERPNG